MREPGQAPTFLTRLIARDDLLALTKSRLEECRLVTLTGPGGAGKTRLAAEIARTAADRPVHWADLVALEDSALVPSVIAEAVAPEPLEAPDDLDTVARILGSAGPALLIIDNCEHLQAACRDLVGRLLSACPSLQVLTTSRVALGVDGEARVNVEPLGVPPSNATACVEVAEYPAVELFLDRAQLHDPSFSLEEADAAAVAEICRLVDGLPLAIEVAAAQVRALSPQDAAARLRQDPLQLAAATHRRRLTLEEVLQWSYDLLDPSSQELLRSLAVFVDGFSLEAAEAVCHTATLPASAVYPTLARLVDHSLVRATRVDRRTRYELPVTVRAFATMASAEEPQSENDASDRAARPCFWLVREGDVWSVGRDDRLSRLKHAKGIAYVHQLVESAGTEVHALDLAGQFGGGIAVSGAEAQQLGLSSRTESVEKVVDTRALSAYKRRFHDLQEELEEARQHHDSEREARVREEMSFLADELGSVTGRGGRARSETSQAEKARVAVTKAIRSAIRRIAEADTEMGRHLEQTVRTGTYCCYEPPGGAPHWKTRRS